MANKQNEIFLNEPIAIIGIGCRFPGDVDSPEKFWQLLNAGRDAVTEIPQDRFDIAALYDARPATPGKVISKWGGFLRDLDKFDAAFFGMSPREAERLDPQQRLLLEVSWEALENAAQVPQSLAAHAAGVFVGMWINDFEDRLFCDPEKIDFYMTTGSGRYTASGRISYALGLQGPSLTVDTACSSSLVAVHLACQSLRSGECRVALAGGANTILRPHISIAYSQSQMLSPDGRCKFGDARANGYVRSEGAAVIVLKRLSDALAEGDPIIALIRGSAVNNDGRSSGSLGTPGVAGQSDMLRKAYDNAGVSPQTVHYVEAHGTGTRAGDPVELQALGNVLGAGRETDRPLWVGSVKTNIGHTEGAAGVAGLIKVALSLKHRAIPRSLHFETPNPEIPWQDLRVAIPTTTQDLSQLLEPLFGGISSFGISGTNAHVVLSEQLSVSSDQLSVDSDQLSVISHQLSTKPVRPSLHTDHRPLITDHYQLLPLSAHTPEALQALARSYQDLLPSILDSQSSTLDALCYTAGVRRSHHEHRLTLVARSKEECAEKLQAFLEGEKRAGMASGQKESDEKRKVVFVFPGQGSQWLGMARTLLAREPAFRESMLRCEEAVLKYVDWRVLEQLALEENAPNYRLHQIDVIQPTLFSIQVSLAALWRAWGIAPQAVIGHSMGEVAAAHVAGALTLDDAARIICRRSLLLRRTSGKGAMAVVELSIAEAEKALIGYEDKLSIAVSNSSRSTVLSGDPRALDEVLAQLEQKEIFCRRIKVDVASHSPQMDPLRHDLLEALAGLQPQNASVPLYSTVQGEIVEGAALDEKYWVDNLRRPVLFAQMVRKLHEDGHDLFIEISAHPLLLPAIQHELQTIDASIQTLASMRREEDEQLVMLEALGGLYAHGYPIDWSRLHPNGARVVRLPNYPWQRESFWLEDSGSKIADRGPRSSILDSQLSNLLGAHFQTHEGAHFWQTELRMAQQPYLADHRVNDLIVFPAAAYAEMALSAAREVFGEGPHVLEQFTFHEALFLADETATTLQTEFALDMPELATFQVFSRKRNAHGAEAVWTRHASGKIRMQTYAAATLEDKHEAPLPMREGAAATQSGAEHYQHLSQRGLQYGPSFQGVRELWPKLNEVWARVQLAEALAPAARAYCVHPALLDACLQVLLAGLSDDKKNSDTCLPVSFNALRVHRQPDPTSSLWAHAVLQSSSSRDTGDVFICDDNGALLLEVRELKLQRLPREPEALADWFYQIAWREQPRAQASQQVGANARWLIFADEQGVAQKLAERMRAQGEECVLVTRAESFGKIAAQHFAIDAAQPAHYVRLFEAQDTKAFAHVVHLWSLDLQNAVSALEEAQSLGALSALYLTQALAQAELETSPRLWLMTSGVHVNVGSNTLLSNAHEDATKSCAFAQAPLWGLAATLANEHPEFRCTRVDLGFAHDAEEHEALYEELRANDTEDQIALRGEKRYVARLLHEPLAEVEHALPAEQNVVATAEQNYSVQIDKPGVLDHLTLRTTPRRAPGIGEVEIQVQAAGLNFLDVMKALGVYPGLDPNAPIALGGECVGVITAVGEGVKEFERGDEVVAITPSFNRTTMLSAYVTVPALLVARQPQHLSAEEACTFPLAFLTAHYALHHLGRMSTGERVLIHSATGGVGLAAVQLAQRAGCEIFATAGSEEKREYLRALGVTHVHDSRALAFADEILKIENRGLKIEKDDHQFSILDSRTHEQGIDLVLNSLAGAAIPKSLEVLRSYGRFLEIGKRDIYNDHRLGLAPFKKNLSYFAIDLAAVIEARPKLIANMFAELVQCFNERGLAPLPHQAFSISEVAQAFRAMAQGKHIGKIVLRFNEQHVMVAPERRGRKIFHEAGAYLITGGLGGLGLGVAQWMVEQGVRHLVLVGRSAASSEAQAAMTEMEKHGAKILAMKADVSHERQVIEMLARIKTEMPRLRGVIHAAGVLADSTLLQMDRSRFEAALAPKMNGAWHLHQHTLQEPLDMFVMFSSVAAVLGTTGQGNYAAGNAFLDALAHHRRALGLPALSINWGPWSQVGLAAAQENRGARLEAQGLKSIAPEQGLRALEKLLASSSAQALAMPFDYARWQEFYPAARAASLFKQMKPDAHGYEPTQSEATAPQTQSLREQLLALEAGRKRRALLETHLQEQIANVLKIKPSVVTRNKAFRSLGLDSLMALELRNRLEASLALTLPATTFFNYPNLNVLATHLAAKMGVALEAEEVKSDLPVKEIVKADRAEERNRAHAEDDNIEKILAEIEQLSEEQARKILAK